MEWQKILLKRGIKKRQKLKKILSLMEYVPKRGIIVGCETGVIGSMLEKKGGAWIHLDKDFETINTSKDILTGPVLKIDEKNLPFKSGVFEIAIIPDFLEHIENDDAFLKEIFRILKRDGLSIITVPHFKKNSLLRRIKNLIGMKDELYGHLRTGYTIEGIERVVKNSGFEIEKLEFYSRSFTEIVELILNIAFVLTGKRKSSIKGSISPVNEEDIEKREFFFKIHGIIHPIFKAFSFLDNLVFLQKGYVIALKARKKEFL
ncbi:MAG: methyltransferase domain-containing protein [Candidatus Aminicenantia bacterium]